VNALTSAGDECFELSPKEIRVIVCETLNKNYAVASQARALQSPTLSFAS